MEWAGKGRRGAEQRKRNGITEMGERGRLCVTGFALCSWLPWCSRGTAATCCAEHPVSSFPLSLFRQ